MINRKKSELLLPGGNLEKIKTALLYGADSIYAGTPDMSLRVKSELTLEDLKEASRITKNNNKKLYLTLNLFSHNKDIEKLPKYLEVISQIKPDGLLIADPGVFAYIRKHAPDIPLHISTQANVCSSLSVNFWKDQGAALCVLAREVTYEELREIRTQCPDIRLEAFIHGAMCMTYSGRCLLSNFMAERGANQGNCAHSCRWKYKIKLKLKNGKLFELDIDETNKELFEFYLEEEFRENDYYEIQEDEMGSYILNSKDLCLMPVLNDYLSIGVDTLKIEGRNKSEYYAAITARAYRYAIDSWYNNSKQWDYKLYMDELYSIHNRGYTLAFHKGRLSNISHSYYNSKTIGEYTFVGVIIDYEANYMIMEIRNFMIKGDILEFVTPFNIEPIRLRIYEFIDCYSNKVTEKVSPGRKGQGIKIPLSLFHEYTSDLLKEFLPKYTVVRKLNNENNIFTKYSNIAFKVENSEATKSILAITTNKIQKILKDDNPPVKKINKTLEESCCLKGCNGCLVFWYEDKYKPLREKIKNKPLGEKLIKNIDF